MQKRVQHKNRVSKANNNAERKLKREKDVQPAAPFYAILNSSNKLNNVRIQIVWI